MADLFSRLLLATEHSEFDRGAEALALAMARRCARPLAAVLPVVSNPEFELVAPQLAARADAEASVKREDLDARARREGVTFDLQVRRGPEPFVEIVDAAREHGADLLVIRRRGRRGLLANLLVGEMVSKVVAHAPCSVLVAPVGAQMWSRRVLVGVDPQAPDSALLAQAAAIAAECDLPLRVVCVAPNEATCLPAELALNAAVDAVRASGCTVERELRIGRTHHELITAAQDCGADLLVIARHGADSNLGRAWIGGVAQKVIGLAECPVLVHVSNPLTKPSHS
jgi:nucleotide-binding universal stress UspA family protein